MTIFVIYTSRESFPESPAYEGDNPTDAARVIKRRIEIHPELPDICIRVRMPDGKLSMGNVALLKPLFDAMKQ